MPEKSKTDGPKGEDLAASAPPGVVSTALDSLASTTTTVSSAATPLSAVQASVTSVPAHWIKSGNQYYEAIYAEGASDKPVGYKLVAKIQPAPAAPAVSAAFQGSTVSVPFGTTAAVPPIDHSMLPFLEEPPVKRAKLDGEDATANFSPQAETRWKFWSDSADHSASGEFYSLCQTST